MYLFLICLMYMGENLKKNKEEKVLIGFIIIYCLYM